MKNIGERAKEFREARGWNTSEMARAVGTSRQNIESLEATGDRKPRYLTALARVMGVSTDDLLSSAHQATSIPPSGNFGHPTAVFSDAGQVSRMARVAVVGAARMGDNGYYEEISSMPGAGDGTVLAQSDDPNAYALRVRGDSMFPAIRDGWYVVIEPGATPTPGEYVLIKLRNGQKMVKELILHRSDSITVVSVNGDKRRTIMADEIDPHYGIQAVVSILAPSKWRP